MPRDPAASLSLRPETAADLSFLRTLFAETRAGEMVQTGWTAETRAAFLDGQFEAQRRDYQRRFPGADFDVIVAAGRPVGRLYVARGAEEIRLVEITLLAAWRGRGWGTKLIGRLCQEGDRRGMPVCLHVYATNRAQRLYRRLGFRETGREGFYLRMERAVGATQKPPPRS